VARAEITPDRPLYLEGYGNRTAPATGTLDPLMAGAVVFDDGERRAALLSADLCGVDGEMAARVQAAAGAGAGVPAEHVVLLASHTHTGPAMTPFGGVAVDAAYKTWLEATLAGLAVTAASDLRPVTLGVGEGAADFNVNRRRRTPDGVILGANPGGLVDRRVRVLRLDPAGADGHPPAARGTLGGRPLPQTDPLAVLFSYACHATVLGAADLLYSGDYPGAARRMIEGAYGEGTTALFLAGCFGNLRPHLLAPDGRFRSATAPELRVLGRRLGSAVVGAAERVVGEPVQTLAAGRGEAYLPYARVPDAAELRAAVGGPQDLWARAMLERLETEGALPAGETVPVHVLRLGRHWLVTTPGETLLEIGLSVERGLAELGLADPAAGDLTLCLSYANGYVGYLPSASAYGEGGYEPATAYPDYLRPGPFAPEVEAALVDTALGVARTLAPEPAPAG